MFLTWWQGLAITGAAQAGLIPPSLTYSLHEIAGGIQNFAICVEMFFAALAFQYYVRRPRRVLGARARARDGPN